MKKKILLSLVSIFVLCTSFISPISAIDDEFVDETQYYGNFNGQDYPIILSNPDIALLYDVSGYSITPYSYASGSSVAFNQAFTVPAANKEYYISCWITLPEPIPASSLVDLEFKFTMGGVNNNSIAIHDINLRNTDTGSAGVFTGGWTLSHPSSVTSSLRFYGMEAKQNVKYISVYFKYKATSTNCSFVVNDVSIVSRANNSVDLSGISDWLSILALNQNEIGVNVIAIRDHCISIIEAINLGFAVTHEKIDLLKESMISKFDSVVSSINSNFSSLNSWIQNQTTSITSKLNDLLAYFKGNEQSNSSVDNNNQSSNNAGNTFDEYNDIESGYMNDMSSNLGSIDTSNNLFAMTDFLATGTFVSTQLENIYNSNVIIQNVIMYGLILGLALTVIGISTKRG